MYSVSFGAVASFQYDDLNRLKNVTHSDGTIISYTYDANGNSTRKVVTKDTSAPTGSVTINGGASFTNNQAGTLTLVCNDEDGNGCAYMQFSKDLVTWYGWETFKTTRSFTITPSGSGVKYIYVKFKDTAGNISGIYNDTVILDVDSPTTTASPSGGSYSTAQGVTLSCNDGTGSGCGNIYYTKDGSNPTISSLIYNGSISISNSTTLKFFARDNVGNNESVKTQVYTILNNLNIVKVGLGNGTVFSVPSGIDCGATCTAGFSYGTSVTLTATPNAVSLFDGWSDSACIGNGQCIHTMSGTATINAYFDLKPGAINVSPTSLNYGRMIIGRKSGSRLVVKNIGGAGLTIDRVTLTNTEGSDFVIVGDACSNTTLSAGVECSIHVLYGPMGKTGHDSGGEIAIPSGDATTPVVKIKLRGEAQPTLNRRILNLYGR